MRPDRPAERAAGIFGIDRHGGATLADYADHLAATAAAFAHRRGAGIFDLLIIEAVAISAADADRERAGRVGGADRAGKQARRHGRKRKIARNPDHQKPLPRSPTDASWEGFQDGEPGAPSEARNSGFFELRPHRH